MDLYHKLVEYSQSDFYPFHMPGHKRRVEHPFLKEFPNPYAIDITEIDGFDNLHHPEEIIKESMERAAKLYGADKSYYLVNGSSCGILSAVCAATRSGETILMSRNCHKAAYHGVFLNQLKTRYVYPQMIEEFGIQGGLLPEKIEELLKTYSDISAVLIVSPTYDGIVSNVEEIAKICHRYGVPLIVDEAHGAHFQFHERFPESALELGADVVIQSLHKTLPAFTQTSILHVQGNLVDQKRLEHYLQIFQSSSPSYLFMAGIERCLEFLTAENEKEESDEGAKCGRWSNESQNCEREKCEKEHDQCGSVMMDQFCGRLKKLRTELAAMKHLRLLDETCKGKDGVWDLDISKIIVSTQGTGLHGEELGEWLRRDYHLEMEMCAAEYVTAITTVMDTEEGFNRLRDALLEIDGKLGSLTEGAETSACLGESMEIRRNAKREKRDWHEGCLGYGGYELMQQMEAVMPIADGWNQADEKILWKDSVGRISGEYVYLYPPGIPFVVPGERITKEIVDLVEQYQRCGYSVQGMEDQTCREIKVVREDM